MHVRSVYIIEYTRILDLIDKWQEGFMLAEEWSLVTVLMNHVFW